MRAAPTVIAVNLSMDASIDFQRVNVRKQCVETTPVIQVGMSRLQDLDFHSARFRRSRFASAQGIGFSSPAW